MSLVTDQADERRLVFGEFGEAADVGVFEEVVVQIVVGGGYFADDAFFARGFEFVIDALPQGNARSSS